MKKTENLIRKFIAPDKQWKVDLLAKWQEIQQFSSYQIKIQIILDKTVVLGVPHPAIAQQLSMSTKQILQKLKEISPNNTIERLAFQVIDFEDSNLQTVKSTTPQDLNNNHEQQLSICNLGFNPWSNIFFSEKEIKILDSLCCKGLKQALKSFYARCKRKEALNVQNQKSQSKNIAFIDSPYINFLAFN